MANCGTSTGAAGTATVGGSRRSVTEGGVTGGGVAAAGVSKESRRNMAVLLSSTTRLYARQPGSWQSSRRTGREEISGRCRRNPVGQVVRPARPAPVAAGAAAPEDNGVGRPPLIPED